LVHFIGKDNIFFHALLFPAMLMEHGGYVLPLNVPANEFLNLEGEKFSTSRNYAVWLPEYLKKFHPDPLRYYLASIAPETRDTDFAWKDFQRRNNNELADILGNFINRALVFAQRYFDGRVPNLNELDENDQQMLRKIKDAPKEIGACLDKFQLREASQKFMDIARAGNIYVDRQKPWDTRKDDISKCQTTINICLQTCKALAVLMHPFMPFSAEKLWNMLNLRGTIEQESWEEAGMPTLEPGHPLNEPEILFPKIEDEVIDAEIAKLSEQQEPGLEILISSEIVDLEYFNKLDIRVANVDSAERIEGTDKLLKLQISIGPEKRIIVAGIGNLYEPEEIIGKRIIVVANLKPVKIKGVLSQGMLLAASLKENIVLLTTEGEIETGAKIV
jgi:methionyl-tRNA synthetase